VTFDDPAAVEQICYDLKLADWPRGKNRALINNTFNGMPPYTAEEVDQNEITVNVNFLEPTKLAHDARTQYSSAFLKPGNYFNCMGDIGPKHKRHEQSDIVTREIGRRMKRSIDYFECMRSRFALNVLHGVGPASWDDKDHWCPDPRGIEDILIPARTLLTMRNLPFFAVYKSFTANQLIKMTQGPKVDKGWNKDLVEKAIKYLDKESTSLMGSNWPEVWSPEKMAERVKGDGGFYSSDQVPTVDCFDFYYWNDDDKVSGWNRRMILDSWSTPASAGASYSMAERSELRGKGQFLFNPGKRKYASKIQELISFQFADLSAVAPFQYHSIRSLGWLLYSICQLQNRLRCRFNEAVFETLLMYLRVNSQDDAQRALKIQLATRGILDETIKFVPREERWNPDVNLAELGLSENQRLINEHSAAFTTSSNMSRDKVEKTKFQVMSEVNATTALISAGLQQAYQYQKLWEYPEILRRFFKKDSADPDVRAFRAAVLRQGVPASSLMAEAWDVEPERTLGAGNKTLEMAIASQLLEARPLYDPEAQRNILRDFTLAITDDPARADDLVPKAPHVSDSIHDTELAFGSLMQGSMVAPKPGLNAVEVCTTMLKLMAAKIRALMQSGGVGTPADVMGLTLCGQYISSYIAILAQDKESKGIVKKLGDMAGKLMNQVKSFSQRQQEMAKKAAQQQAQSNGGVDPKDMAKIKATQITAQAKADNMRESHAQRTSQRQLAFEAEQRQQAEKHAADIQAKDLEAASEIRRNRMRSTEE